MNITKLEKKNNKKFFKNLFFSQSGLSILEILIASTVLAFMGILIVELTDSSSRTKDRVISEDREFMQFEMAMNKMEWDISQMYTPLYFSSKAEKKSKSNDGYDENDQYFEDDFDENDKFSYSTSLGHPVPIYKNPDSQTFEFLMSGHRRKRSMVKESSFAWVRYSLQRSDDPEEKNMNLVRFYDAKNIYGEEKIDPEKSLKYILLERVKEMEFSFWDEKKKKFMESLNFVENGFNILRAVKLRLVWVSKNGIEIEEIRIFRSIWPEFIEKKEDEKKNDAN